MGRSGSDLSSSDLPSSQERPKPESVGLPKPRMYRHKKPRKEKQECRQDSSEKEKSILLGQDDVDNNMQSVIAKIENNFTSPMRVLLKTPDKPKEGAVRTSTPCRNMPNSPGAWISPIKGLTPGSEEKLLDLDSGFLTPEAKMHLMGSDSSEKSNKSGSPNLGLGSLREFGLPGLTPLKTPLGAALYITEDSPNGSLNLSNQSFTKLLGDFHFDSMMEEGLANISWSALQ